MTAIAQELDRTLQTVNAATAQRLEQLVREALALAEAAPGGDDFAREVAAEAALRERLAEAGRQFSAKDRLSREELLDRDALR